MNESRGLTLLELLRARLDQGGSAKEDASLSAQMLEEAGRCLRVEPDGSLSRKRLAELELRMAKM